MSKYRKLLKKVDDMEKDIQQLRGALSDLETRVNKGCYILQDELNFTVGDYKSRIWSYRHVAMSLKDIALKFFEIYGFDVVKTPAKPEEIEIRKFIKGSGCSEIVTKI